MGKVEIGNICCLTAEIKFFFFSSMIHMNFSKLLNLIGCHGNIKGKFSKKYSKIFSSEAIRGMKMLWQLNPFHSAIKISINATAAEFICISNSRCP